MAFYVGIKKLSEVGDDVVYEFTGDEGNSGEFRISKLSGEVTLLKEMLGNNGEKSFQRAAVKIRKEWKNGVLPNVTEWAS